MADNEVIERGEMVERAAAGVQLGSLSVADPGQVVVMAQKIAEPLARMIDERRLFAVISGRKHVYVEGWATCGAMLGVVPRLLEEHEDPNNPGEFVATVEAVRSCDGVILGRAKASCGPDESTWKSRSRQARRSMAQTRATGKVFRLLFSWVMQLAGYETTPFEEMDEGPMVHPNADRNPDAPRTQPRAQRQKPVTKDEVLQLHKEWLIANPGEQSPTAFTDFIFGKTGREFNPRTTSEWTRDDLNRCFRALGITEE